jgi:hypothetical protein
MKYGPKIITVYLTGMDLSFMFGLKTINDMEHVWSIKVEVNVTIHGSKHPASYFDRFIPRF